MVLFDPYFLSNINLRLNRQTYRIRDDGDKYSILNKLYNHRLLTNQHSNVIESFKKKEPQNYFHYSKHL